MARWSTRRWGCIGVAGALLLPLLSLVATPVGLRGMAVLRESGTAASEAPAGGHFLTIEGEGVFLLEHAGSGDVDGRLARRLPVVLISGVGAWSGTWRDTLMAVGDAGHRAIAIDLPPFGFSEPPAAATYGRGDQAARIWGTLDALGIRDAVLVGHSFGGGPTLEAALQRPDRVRALVLVAGAIGLDSVGQRSAMASVVEVPGVAELLAASTATNPWVTRSVVHRMVADPAVVTDDRVALYQAFLGVQGTTSAVADWMPSVLYTDPRSLSVQPDQLRAFEPPTFLVWGDADDVTPLSQATELNGLFPRSQLTVLTGVGHLPHIEDVAAFHEALLPFLATAASHDDADTPRSGAPASP